VQILLPLFYNILAGVANSAAPKVQCVYGRYSTTKLTADFRIYGVCKGKVVPMLFLTEHHATKMYERVSKSFRTESITK